MGWGTNTQRSLSEFVPLYCRYGLGGWVWHTWVLVALGFFNLGGVGPHNRIRESLRGFSRFTLRNKRPPTMEGTNSTN